MGNARETPIYFHIIFYCAVHHSVIKQINRLIVFMHISIKSDLMSDNVVQLRTLHVLYTFTCTNKHCELLPRIVTNSNAHASSNLFYKYVFKHIIYLSEMKMTEHV